jgi:hypothetical protein
MKRYVAPLVAVASLWCSATAFAAPVSGEGSDRRDAAPGKPDLERVLVSYDGETGRILVTFRFYRMASNQALHVRLGLSKPGQGGCLASAQEPDLDFRGFGAFDTGVGISGRATLHPRTGSTTVIPTDIAQEAFPSYTWRIGGPSTPPDNGYEPLDLSAELQGRGFRCVTRVFADSDPNVEDGDQIRRFCLGAGDCVEQAAAPPRPEAAAVTPPPAPPAQPAAPPVITHTPPVVTPTPVVSNPARPTRALTRSQAATSSRRALRRAFGRTFRERTRFTSACRRTSATRWTCRVSWRYRGSRYRGRVVVASSGGRVPSTTVRVRRAPARS